MFNKWLALAALILSIESAHLVAAQDISNEGAIGFPENGTFHGSSFDNVQLNNGNLHIEIPLWSVEGRGVPVLMKMIYDNKTWRINVRCDRSGICTGQALPGPRHMISISDQFGYTVSYDPQVINGCGSLKNKWRNYYLTEPDGTTHHFKPDVQCTGDPGIRYASDGSGWRLQTTTDSGGVISVLRTDGLNVRDVTDSNGNQLTLSGNPQIITDTAGRIYARDGSYKDSNGTLQPLAITYTTVPISTNLCGFYRGVTLASCTENTAIWTVPQTITLANGMQYTFQYEQNQYGEPNLVTLPTGGQISWTWGPPHDMNGRAATSRTETANGTSAVWRYGFTYSLTDPPYIATATVTDPANNDTKTTFTCFPSNDDAPGLHSPPCYESKIETFQGSTSSGTKLKTVDKVYTTLASGPTVLTRETTLWNPQNLASMVETDWDAFVFSGFTTTWRNIKERREYAFGVGSPGALVRKTHYNYLHVDSGSASTYRNVNVADRPISTVIYDGSGNIVAQTNNTYDGVAIPTSGDTSANPAPNHDYVNFPRSYNFRGNLTQVSRGLKVGGTWTWLNTNNTYNDLGQLLTSTDPGGHQTSYDYTDSWASIANPQCVTSAHTYGFPTTVTDALSHRTKHTYYSCTSLTGSTQDENDIAAARPGTTYSFDLLSRANAVNSPDGGQTTFSYSDTVPYSTTSTQLIKTSPTLNKVSTTVFDGLGRVQQTQLVDPDCSSGPVKADYTYGYDSAPPPTGTPAGRFTTVSNPYCTTSDSTYGVTKTRYDALDRRIRVIPPDGSDSANNVSTTYSGTTTGLTTTVTDQASASRKNQTDALGRLTLVLEDPLGVNYETDYAYDERDNLTGVTQKGGAASSLWRNRSFQYDSLSRLTQAINPESGIINYSYDADSNLFQKIAPQANQQLSATTTTTYCYDQVHRLTGKAYTALTCPLTSPPVSFLYDQTSYNGLTIANGIGWRTGMNDSAGTTGWSFDPMGRPAAERRTLNTNVTKSFTFSYYKDGEIQQTVWPTAHQVTYAPSAAGRTVSALGTSFNFVTAATYAPQGAISSAIFGSATGFNGITVADTYNKRLQPSTITASLPNNSLVQSLTYDFHINTANNGNVFKITNGKDANRTQNFTYDTLNRIKTAATQGTSGSTCWGQKFGYMSNGSFVYGPDPWGNLTEIQSTQCTSPTLSQGITTKNQFASPMVYDAAGNLTNDGSHPFTYDTENRLATAGGVTYTYDGDGKRVKKSNGTLYWTGPGSDPLLETDLSGNATAEYVFFNGKRVARVDMPGNSPKYYFEDHLGSTDVVTNSTGGIVEESDYVPYGGEVVINGSDPNHFKFTGKERDPESGLDNFEARHYSSGFGRFMQADEFAGGPTDLFDSDDPASSPLPYADITDPQSLNKYSYTYNNPLRYVDPEGHQVVEELEQVVQATPPPARPILVLPPVAAGVILGVVVKTGIDAYANHIQSKADKEIEDTKESNRAKLKDAAEKEAAPKEPKEPEASSDGNKKGTGRNGLPPDARKLKGDQGYRDSKGNTWKKDKLHKDHWDVSDKKGRKVKEVGFDGKQIWPKGPKHKHKKN